MVHKSKTQPNEVRFGFDWAKREVSISYQIFSTGYWIHATFVVVVVVDSATLLVSNFNWFR